MKVLFLTSVRISNISDRGIYNDLLRKFRDEGHDLYIATPSERRYRETTSLIKRDNVIILRIKTLNIQKTNIIEKGLSTLLIEYQFLSNIKKHFTGICFDLVLFSTPPITFTKVISYIKHKDSAVSYLLLKDIFPQNAVDLGMIKQGSLLHSYFIKKEKELYAISDHIGCMSPANVDYILKHNTEINPGKVEVNPNSIEPIFSTLSIEQKLIIRRKFRVSVDSTVFVYGGNLGKPQGIAFLIEVLYSQINRKDIFFVIVGNGTEYSRLKSWFNQKKPNNAILLSELPKREFDMLIQTCDVGLVFLDKRFTIPNFPSRLLSYLEFKMPVIAATDKNTDFGRIMMENGFGLWVENGDLQTFICHLNLFLDNKFEIIKMGNKGYQFMMNNYTVSSSYFRIMKHFANV